MTSRPSCALVIDDERHIRHTLGVCLRSVGCTATAVGAPKAALTAVAERFFDLAFLDLRLGDSDGVQLIAPLLAAQPHLPIIVMTAYATLETAVHAIKLGALNYLEKPLTPAQVRQAHQACLAATPAALAHASVLPAIGPELLGVDLSTQAAPMQFLLQRVALAAPHDAAVLLQGETGAGKGIVTRYLHALSRRCAGPFVTVNCPSLSDELLSSELFGHARGAFTGAVRDQAGRVEVAEGGTLFLDEVTEMSAAIQARLLRFLQDKQFERLGESRTRQADVRVVAATNRDLQTEVAQGRFREDLFYRLNVISLRVPPLRERSCDILPLARHFLAVFARAAGRRVPALSAEAEMALTGYPWPGNVRELRNAMERAVILHAGALLGPEAFAEAPTSHAAHACHLPSLGGDFTLDAVTGEHIKQVLARAASQEEAARILGVHASTLWRQRKKEKAGSDML